MGSNITFWIGAGILALVVIILLVVWNVNQLTRQNLQVQNKRAPKPQRSKNNTQTDAADAKDEEDDELWTQRRQDYEARTMAHSAEAVQETEQTKPFARPTSANQEGMLSERKVPFGRIVTRVHKPKTLMQSMALNPVPAPEEQVTINEKRSSAGIHTLIEDGIAQAPVVLEQQEMESALDNLDEDKILRLSAYEGFTNEVEDAGLLDETEVFCDLLAARLAHPRILGWMCVLVSGIVVGSDQPYDEEVTQQLCSLAVLASETAALVGLTQAREFLVRGVEGMILVVPAARVVPDRSEYVIVFLESEEDYELIMDRLVAQDEMNDPI